MHICSITLKRYRRQFFQSYLKFSGSIVVLRDTRRFMEHPCFKKAFRHESWLYIFNIPTYMIQRYFEDQMQNVNEE